jgi:hypothetical protein
MSTLQVSLAIIGGLVLAGVVAYNAWVTRRNLPLTVRDRSSDPAASNDAPNASAFSETAPAGADDDGRIDPVLDDDLPTRPDHLGEPDDQDCAVSATPLSAPQSPSVTFRPLASAPDKRPTLDALIDVIAPLALEHEVSGDAVLAALPGTRRVGSKPFAVEGQCTASAEWESPRQGQRYRALQAGVQLANRAGALNDIEFSEFVVTAQAFADNLGATPDFPEMRAEVTRARELDGFASGHDAQLGFTLRARRAAWSPGYVTLHAARQGFVAGSLPGRMVLPGSSTGQAPILSLVFDPQAAMAEDPDQSALRELALSLEVTHVPRSQQPFVRMREAAAALAEAMDGVVTDDAGKPLSSEALDQIGADLESLYDALDGHDLSAGSAQARRLFS